MSEWGPVQATIQTVCHQLGTSLARVDSLAALQAWLAQAAAVGVHPSPAATVLATATLAAIAVFLLSLASGNASWVDRLWSILPVYYAWVFVLHSSPKSLWDVHPRVALITALCTTWGARLTYNFWRKGGYTWSGEDYRWPVLRARLHPALFLLFNATFISWYQNMLLASLLAPALVVWEAASNGGGKVQALNAIDAAAATLALSFLAMEAVADNQQWRFQTVKHALLIAKKPLTGAYAQGFITSGLWRYSRHPNFFAEQAFWWSLCLFATAATGRAVGWWLGGAAMLSILFQGSTTLTESLTAARYPGYAAYQSTTSRLIPWFPAKPAKVAAKAVGPASMLDTREAVVQANAAAPALMPKAPRASDVDRSIGRSMVDTARGKRATISARNRVPLVTSAGTAERRVQSTAKTPADTSGPVRSSVNTRYVGEPAKVPLVAAAKPASAVPVPAAAPIATRRSTRIRSRES